MNPLAGRQDPKTLSPAVTIKPNYGRAADAYSSDSTTVPMTFVNGLELVGLATSARPSALALQPREDPVAGPILSRIGVRPGCWVSTLCRCPRHLR